MVGVSVGVLVAPRPSSTITQNPWMSRHFRCWTCRMIYISSRSGLVLAFLSTILSFFIRFFIHLVSLSFDLSIYLNLHSRRRQCLDFFSVIDPSFGPPPYLSANSLFNPASTHSTGFRHRAECRLRFGAGQPHALARASRVDNPLDPILLVVVLPPPSPSNHLPIYLS